MNRFSVREKKTTKGQGALEYLLLIGGAVLIATIVLLIIIGSTGSTNDIINNNLAQYQNRVTLGGTGGGNPSTCGNPPNQLHAGEACDGTAFAPPQDGTCVTFNPSLYSGGNLTCTNCAIEVGSCIPIIPPSMASFASVDWAPMTQVLFSPVANASTTNGWTLTNTGSNNIVIGSIIPTFGPTTVTLDTIALDGTPIFSGPLASGASTGPLNAPTGIVITPGIHTMDLTFSGAFHSLSVDNFHWLQFNFSDASSYNSPILQDRVFSLGPIQGTCMGGTFSSIGPVTGGSVTDRDTFTDYGIATHWTYTPSGSTPIGVAYATARFFNVASPSGSTGQEYFRTLTAGEYADPCNNAGLDTLVESGVGGGFIARPLQPNDTSINRTRNFDVESLVTPTTQDMYLMMTGDDVDGSGVFRSYQSGITVPAPGSNPPALVVGFVLPAP